MSIHEAHQAAPTPEQQTALEIGDVLGQYKFSLAGHGTPDDNPASFFENGIQVSRGNGLTETAIPIEQSNISAIDDWPHKKYSPLPNVVLLAVPFPDPDRGVYYSDINERTFRDPSDDYVPKRAYPPDLIVGFYNPKSKELVMNPDFDMDNETHDTFIEEISRRAQKYRSTQRRRLAARLGAPATPKLTPPPAESLPGNDATDQSKAPLVW